MGCAGAAAVHVWGWNGAELRGGETAKWVGTAITSQANVCAGSCFRFEKLNIQMYSPFSW